MKRCMVVTNSLTGGGAERSMNLLCNELHKRSWSILLVPLNSSEADLVQVDCEVFSINRKWQGGFFTLIVALWQLNKLVYRWKPDCILLNCDLPELLGSLLIPRSKIVVLEHSNIPWAKHSRLGLIVRKVLSLRKADFVTVSKHLQVWPRNKTPDATIENIVSVKSLNYNPALESNISRLIYIGRLSHEKRPEFIIDIGRSCKLPILFIGDGYLRQYLESSSGNLHLHSNFTGHVRAPWSFLMPGDLVIVPSETEGDGLVALEGIILGVPIIMSEIPEFLRFGLPDKHYASQVPDFVSKVNLYKKKLCELVAPTVIRDSIKMERSSENIGNKWEKFLQKI